MWPVVLLWLHNHGRLARTTKHHEANDTKFLSTTYLGTPKPSPPFCLYYIACLCRSKLRYLHVYILRVFSKKMCANKGVTTLGGSDSHLYVVIGLGQPRHQSWQKGVSHCRSVWLGPKFTCFGGGGSTDFSWLSCSSAPFDILCAGDLIAWSWQCDYGRWCLNPHFNNEHIYHY
jgi:hypothetical protein